MKLGVRLPVRLALDLHHEPGGLRVTHTIRAGFAGIGRIFDPLIDDAVFFGEKLLDVASHHPGDEMYTLLATAIPVVDGIFEARVGSSRARLVLGPMDPRPLNLKPRAAHVRSLAECGATVAQVLAASRLPRRDGVRIVANLLRRGALSTGPESPSVASSGATLRRR